MAKAMSTRELLASTVSVFDMFKIGIGPSSSHTLGPWRAAQAFVARLRHEGQAAGWGLGAVTRITVELFGSLAKTGAGHGTDRACVLGLEDADPVTAPLERIRERVSAVRSGEPLLLGGERFLRFDVQQDLQYHRSSALPRHPNGLRFTAWEDERCLARAVYYSTGGGFILEGDDDDEPMEHAEGAEPGSTATVPDEYGGPSARELAELCGEEGIALWQLSARREEAERSPDRIAEDLDLLSAVMLHSAYRGATQSGELPGGLHVVRRAKRILAEVLPEAALRDEESWLQAVLGARLDEQGVLRLLAGTAMAVNEENAAFGRIVTAPTNGAAGVIPAVLLYRLRLTGLRDPLSDAGREASHRFLLTAGLVGSLFKQHATISAAMGGCQAEIGVASAMAAAALTEALGGSVEQVFTAAEIAMEHHLGLTCDPVGGLVQVPCIERNSFGAVKAVTAALLATDTDPRQAKVSLDAVMDTMWHTALDMNSKYKETSEAGLALTIPANVVEC
jgi:L-serine dehydratase